MPEHRETRILPYKTADLFVLVLDIERYPEFLPWCRAAEITEKRTGQLSADLIIGYKIFEERFTSHVAYGEPAHGIDGSIKVTYGGGPLRHLVNEWQFRPVGRGKTEIDFYVSFEFHSRLLGNLMDIFFDRAFLKMVSAFEARAAELYDK
jgi:coenzyme Q-binding protein COQ10